MLPQTITCTDNLSTYANMAHLLKVHARHFSEVLKFDGPCTFALNILAIPTRSGVIIQEFPTSIKYTSASGIRLLCYYSQSVAWCEGGYSLGSPSCYKVGPNIRPVRRAGKIYTLAVKLTWSLPAVFTPGTTPKKTK